MTPEELLLNLLLDIRSGSLHGELPAKYRVLALDSLSEHGLTPLMVAAIDGREDAVITLIRSGAHVGARGRRDVTALHDAAGNGHVEIVRLLLAAGAEINSEAIDGCTPLMLAASSGEVAIVRLLLAHGADASRTDARGATAADIASEKGYDEVAAVLDTAR